MAAPSNSKAFVTPRDCGVINLKPVLKTFGTGFATTFGLCGSLGLGIFVVLEGLAPGFRGLGSLGPADFGTGTFPIVGRLGGFGKSLAPLAGTMTMATAMTEAIKALDNIE